MSVQISEPSPSPIPLPRGERSKVRGQIMATAKLNLEIAYSSEHAVQIGHV